MLAFLYGTCKVIKKLSFKEENIMRKRIIALSFATIIGIMLSMNIVGCKKAEAPATDENAPATEEPAEQK
jgi:hypothetical protein